MKLNSNNFDTWQKGKTISSFKKILVYGPDEAAIEYIYHKILLLFSKEGFQKTVITHKEIRDEPSLLNDSLNEASLFGDKKVIVLDDISNPAKAFLDSFIQPIFQNHLIVKAGDLKPTSALRKVCETNKDFLVVPCYAEEPKSIEMFIITHLKANNVNFDRDVPSMLSQILPSNRSIVMQELGKLLLYVGSSRSIECQDVEEVCIEARETNFDDLCEAFALKNYKMLNNIFRVLHQSEVSIIGALRIMQRYFDRVLFVLSNMKSGMQLIDATSKLTPPLFFKAKDRFMKIAKTLTYEQSLKITKFLMECELLAKQNYLTADALVQNKMITFTQENL